MTLCPLPSFTFQYSVLYSIRCTLNIHSSLSPWMKVPQSVHDVWTCSSGAAFLRLHELFRNSEIRERNCAGLKIDPWTKRVEWLFVVISRATFRRNCVISKLVTRLMVNRSSVYRGYTYTLRWDGAIFISEAFETFITKVQLITRWCRRVYI